MASHQLMTKKGLGCYPLRSRANLKVFNNTLSTTRAETRERSVELHLVWFGNTQPKQETERFMFFIVTLDGLYLETVGLALWVVLHVCGFGMGSVIIAFSQQHLNNFKCYITGLFSVINCIRRYYRVNL